MSVLCERYERCVAICRRALIFSSTLFVKHVIWRMVLGKGFRFCAALLARATGNNMAYFCLIGRFGLVRLGLVRMGEFVLEPVLKSRALGLCPGYIFGLGIR